MDIKQKKFKVHSLTGRIDLKLMKNAFKAVKKKRGAAGIDHVSIDTYKKNEEQNLIKLMNKLKKRGNYKCAPLKRVLIPKGNTGKFRKLGIPTIEDRIAQEVIRQLINPTFDAMFHENSFGFRSGRGCHQALRRVLEYKQKGYNKVVDIDIEGFFDNIEHDIIMAFICAEIADGNVLGIIESFLRSGVKEEDKIIPTTKGTPQGGVISPLLANITLNYLDWQLESVGYKFVRYADDIVIMCKTDSEAENALQFTLKVLKDLKLVNSTEKTKIAKAGESFEFLGFNIKKQSVVIREKSRKKFEDSLRAVTTRKHNLEDEVHICMTYCHLEQHFQQV